jgi:hypothetical protein
MKRSSKGCFAAKMLQAAVSFVFPRFFPKETNSTTSRHGYAAMRRADQLRLAGGRRANASDI